MAMPMHLYSQMLSEQKSAGQAPRPSSARLSGDQAATVQFLLKKIADAESRAKMAEHRAQRAEAALAVMGKGPPPPGASFKGHTLQQYRQAPGFSGNTPGSPNLMLRPHSPRSPRSGFPDRGASAPPARRAWAPQSPRREIFDTKAVHETPTSADAMLTGLRQISPNRKLEASHLTGDQAGLKSTGLIFEAHRVFTLSDSDRNGTLDVQEMQRMQRMLTQIDPDLYPAPLTPAFANKVISAAIDTDGDGVVDRGEWIAFVTQQAKASGERPMLKLMQLLGKQLDKCWR